MQISDELLKKYNAPVPRYTSYPPANHFREFTADEYIGLVSNSNNRRPENIAFYIHIPFCKRICHYCGCNSCSLGKGSQVPSYMEALKKEIRLVTGMLDRSRPVSQVHYGGGTPNAIDPRYLKEINDMLFSEFRFIEDPEIAIECNPEHMSFDQIDTLADAGFNRFSIGIQDFDEDVLRIANRAPSHIPADELLGYLKKKNNKASINFDFIFGLPGQTVSSFTDSIARAAEIRPDRLVTFSYAHVPWLKKHQLILEKKGLPETGEKMKMFLGGYNRLKDAGYEPLGLDHYVLPGDDLFRAYRENTLHRNFQGYCTRRTTGQVYAFGVTGISQLEEGYSQNTKDIQKYVDDISKGVLPVDKGYVLTASQKITREVLDRLMCNKKISFSEIAEDLEITISNLKEATGFREERVSMMMDDGLLNFNGDELEVTTNGTMFIRNIAVIFDREYIEKNQTYSRTV